MKRYALRNALYSWRFYKRGREDYAKSMEQLFPKNLHGIWIVSLFLATFLIISSLTVLPFMHDVHAVLEQRGVLVAIINFSLGIGAIFFAFYARHKYRQYQQGERISNALIYALVLILYIAIILTGIHQSVWSNPEDRAVLFMVFLVCALFLVNASPVFNLTLIVSAVIFFIISTITYKEPNEWVMDLLNLIAVVPIAIAYSWYVNFYRMSATINEVRLEEERDKYRSQSTLDELTGLNNRRDFMQRFQRYLTNPREADKNKYLCLAIIDIDHFKDYNDHYGHPQGDECLRALGSALNSLRESPGAYAARIGGEEFALLWFGEDIGGIKNAIAHVQQQIKNLHIPHAKSPTAQHVTVSIGMHATPYGTFDNTDAIYNLADNALYQAKTSGRNRAVVLLDDEKHRILAP
jgi:diguanylate cyclase (GGDEF)-like protein